MDTTKQPGIRIAQIFLEHAHFQHREDHLSFTPQSSVQPEIEISFESGVSPDKKRGRIRAQVRTASSEEALYQFDVMVTALLEQVDGQENFGLEPYLASNGWALLYPFLRETVANMTGRGRFGPVWLDPVNVLAVMEASDRSAGESNAER